MASLDAICSARLPTAPGQHAAARSGGRVRSVSGFARQWRVADQPSAPVSGSGACAMRSGNGRPSAPATVPSTRAMRSLVAVSSPRTSVCPASSPPLRWPCSDSAAATRAGRSSMSAKPPRAPTSSVRNTAPPPAMFGAEPYEHAEVQGRDGGEQACEGGEPRHGALAVGGYPVAVRPGARSNRARRVRGLPMASATARPTAAGMASSWPSIRSTRPRNSF